MKKRTLMIFLSLILILAVCLRLPMVTTGLPYLFHPDEYGLNNVAYENVKYSTIEAKVFSYGYYSYYLYTFVDYLVFKTGLLNKEQVALEPRDFYLTNRIVSFLLSVTAVLLSYFLGNLLLNEISGLSAALFFAVSPMFIESSCIIKPESGMVAFTIAALIFIIKSSRAPIPLNFFLAAFFSITAVFFKYNAAPVLIPLLIAAAPHFKRKKREILGGFGLALLFLCLSLTPIARLLPKMYEIFSSDLVGHTVAGGGASFPNFFFMPYLFTGGMTYIPFILGIAGLIFFTFKKPRGPAAMLAFTWANFLFLFFIKSNFTQYALIPAASLYFLAALLAGKAEKNRKALWALVILAVLSSCPQVYYLLSEHLSTDTRIQARNWIEKNISPEDPLIYNMGGPPFNDYDPPINANPSLVDPSRDTSYSNLGLIPERLFGYRYYAVNSYGNKSTSDIPGDFGRPLALFRSQYKDRPEITVFENIKFYKYTAKTLGQINLHDKNSWHVFTHRDTSPAAGPAGGNGIRLSFKDIRRKEGWHYFVQHTDLLAVFNWEYSVKNPVFVRMTLNWSPDVRLDVVFSATDKMDDGAYFYALEGKRGLGRPREFVFPVLLEKVKSIIFLADTPQNRAFTGREYGVVIEKAELISIPEFYP